MFDASRRAAGPETA